MKLSIRVLSGPDLEKHELYKNFPITIGRLEDNEFVLQDSFTSRRHCTIYIESNYFVLHDLNSTNGTFVNSKRVNTTKVISNGDTLIIGRTVVGVEILD